MLSAAPSEPALKPYQPNHSRRGAEQDERHVVRLHRILAPADPLAQHERKGEAGRPGVDVHRGTAGEVLGVELVEDPARAETQLATGKYTIVTQMATKSDQPQNFARSATAPEIRAGVMIANISWNIAKTSTGTPALSVLGQRGPDLVDRPKPQTLPTHRVAEPEQLVAAADQAVTDCGRPNASEKPYSAQSTPTMAMQMKFIISMFSTLFERTMPP